jgi:hypothetical protein
MGKAIASKAAAIGVSFGMKEQEIRELPAVKKWLETVLRDQYWLKFK